MKPSEVRINNIELMIKTFKDENTIMKKTEIKKRIKGFSKLIHHKQITAIPVLVNEKQVLEDRVALITGGSKGLGLEFARAFIDCGCKVIIAGRNKNSLLQQILIQNKSILMP